MTRHPVAEAIVIFLLGLCVGFIFGAETAKAQTVGGTICKSVGGVFEQCGAPKLPIDHSWHVLAVTNGGTINLLKNLTKHEADFTCDRMMGRPATKAEKAAAKKAAAEEAKREAAEKARDDALVRSKAPKCPAGTTARHGPLWDKWYQKHQSEMMIELPGTEEAACILPDGSIDELWRIFGPLSGFSAQPDNAAMKSCEVFR